MKITRQRLMEIAGLTEAIDPNSTYRIDTDFDGFGVTSGDVKKISGDPLTAARVVKQEAIKSLGGDELVDAFQLDKYTYYITTGEEGVTVVGSPRSPKYGGFWASPDRATIKQMGEDAGPISIQ